MSIGIYAFLRIYFLSFGLSAFAQFRTHCPTSSAAAVPIAQRVQRLGVCRALHGLPWYLPRPGSGTVCPAACAVRSVRAGVSTGGVYSRRPAPPGQSRHHRKNKKGSKKSPHPLLSISKISRKNKKTPTKGLCFVLYLPYKP